jgi:regulator of sigma D
MDERVSPSLKSNAKSQSTSLILAKPRLFSDAQLLHDEHRTDYDELLDRFREVIIPSDILEEMFVAEVVALEWEVLRWRRVKAALIRARAFQALKGFLRQKLSYDLYRDKFEQHICEVLIDNLQDGEETAYAHTLARRCADNEPKAVEEVKDILDAIDCDLDQFLADERGEKAEELLEGFAQGKSDVVTQINEILAGAGLSMESLTADAIAEQLDYVERIDHLTAIAENRRNASLREIERHRAVFGQALRRTAADIEDRELKLVEAAPTEGEDSA